MPVKLNSDWILREWVWFVGAFVLTVLVIGLVLAIRLPPKGPPSWAYWAAAVSLYLFTAGIRATIWGIKTRKK